MKSIELFYEDIESLNLQKKIIEKHINRLIKNELKMYNEISIIICSDEYLLSMNKEYLDHDYYTDIITFDYVEGDVVSGDLFISHDRVKENAIEFGVEVKIELFRVIFHGVLHLVGYKDKSDEEQMLMREKENFYLSEVDFEEIEL